MALTQSTMMPLGTPAPDFALPNVHGGTIRRTYYMGKPLLIVFICNHCPFVKHIAPALSQFALEYQQRGLAVLGIMSNDFSQYPDDAPDQMKREADQRHYTFPYLCDESQQVAHAYTAACTPDFFLFDKDHKLVYRGQFDETRPGRISSGNYDFTTTPATGKDLRAAADALLAGKPVPEKQCPSAGCNIKWKPGNEPAYYG
ncbi:MAG: thioredoxin family protein [Phycisphaerales bacterium]